MVTMVVLFSLVAMTSKSVCKCLALVTALFFSHFIGAAHLAYRRLLVSLHWFKRTTCANSRLMSTQYIRIVTCLSCIATNRLVLSLRGLYYTNHPGNTTIATTNSKPPYERQIKERNSTYAVASHHHDSVDLAMEELNDSRHE
jgi:hypothetical protein